MNLYLSETEKLMRSVALKGSQGRLEEIVEFHFSSKGKFNRPKAVGLLASAFNIQSLKTLGWAAALEMFHNGAIIHDDLQDGDVLRRGMPTVWKKFSPNMAINAGSYLILNAYECLRESEVEDGVKLELSRLLSKLGSDVLEGQCLENELLDIPKVKGLRGQYFRVIGLKTASLYGALAKGVGIIGDLGDDEQKGLERIFQKLGLLFQIQDDILDLFGDKQKDMQGNDLKEGKMSFLILKHLESYHYNHESIKKLLKRHRSNILRGEILIMKEQFARDGTLARALSELVDSCHSLVNDEWLMERERVKNVVEVFVSEIMKPLKHLDEIQSAYGEGLSKTFFGHSWG